MSEMPAIGTETDTPSVKPYLATSHGVLFQGDCIDLMANLDEGCVDSIFADPPFNLDKDYGQGVNDNLPEDEYLAWTKMWLSEAIRVLKPGGSIFIYNIPKWLIPTGNMLDAEFGMTFRHWIALTMKNTYPRGRSLYPAHYGILYYTKGEPSTVNKLRVPIPTCRHCGRELKDYGGHRNKLNPRGLNLTDFWEDTSPVRHRKFKKRPANELKPMIPERCILLSTNPGDLVLDPFGGGGSTYEVAEMRHRRWVGSEIGNCEPIRDRLLDAGIECELEPDPTLTPMEWVDSVRRVAEQVPYEAGPEEIGEAPLLSGPARLKALRDARSKSGNGQDGQQTLPVVDA